MSAPVKFQSLKLNNKYIVIAYSQFNSPYGDSHILQVTDENGKEFELWSTQLINEYISSESNNNLKKFTFTVRKHNDKLYPEIEGYYKRKLIKLNN